MALSDAVPYAVAHWTLDESSGTRADSVGSSNLTDINTVDVTTGIFGNAASFTSANSEYLSVADNPDLSGADADLVVRCWFKITGGSGTRVIAGKWGSNTTSREYVLYVNASLVPIFVVNGAAAASATWGSALALDTWYLCHGWHDGVTNVVGISINSATAVTASHASGIKDTSTPFEIGRSDTSTNYLSGAVDDLVVLKGYLLDSTERTADYNGGTGVAFADWGGVGGGTTQVTRLGLYGGPRGASYAGTGGGGGGGFYPWLASRASGKLIGSGF